MSGDLDHALSQQKIQQNVEKLCEFYLIFIVVFAQKSGWLVKSSEFTFKVFILCFQAYLCSFCTISSGLCVQFRHLLANLRKIYIHDVNIYASQADRALNWTVRINKIVDRVTQE